jgi:hypothetical protein
MRCVIQVVKHVHGVLFLVNLSSTLEHQTATVQPFTTLPPDHVPEMPDHVKAALALSSACHPLFGAQLVASLSHHPSGLLPKAKRESI